MKVQMKRWRTVIGTGTVVLCGVVSLFLVEDRAAAQGGDYQTIRGFEVPEFDRDNRLKTKLFGEFARILPSGLVDITKMRIDFFDNDRQVEMRVTAETCLYDRISRNAESDSRVRIARNRMIITGDGFKWNAENGQFEIYDDAKVVLKGALRSVDKEGFE